MKTRQKHLSRALVATLLGILFASLNGCSSPSGIGSNLTDHFVNNRSTISEIETVFLETGHYAVFYSVQETSVVVQRDAGDPLLPNHGEGFQELRSLLRKANIFGVINGEDGVYVELSPIKTDNRVYIANYIHNSSTKSKISCGDVPRTVEQGECYEQLEQNWRLVLRWYRQDST